MGRSGATRKPNALKKRDGTFNATRDSGIELAPAYPEPPGILDAEAGCYWEALREKLEPIGLVAAVDATALALLANAMHRYVTASAELKEEGEVLEGQKGGYYQHPMVSIRDKAEDRIRKSLIEFGMTPAARSGLKPTRPGDADPLAPFFKDRMN